ncbi:MAG: hypothetical protein ACR2G3_00095 [Solirubrobacterales bacterium]
MLTIRIRKAVPAGFCALLALAVLALAAGTTPATAQEEFEISSVTQDQYDDGAARFAGGGDAGEAGVGSLPFTGLDLVLMGTAAAGLLGAGFVLRRRAAAGEAAG